MTTNLPRDLGGGLVLRAATPDDTDRLASFHAALHSDQGPDRPDESVGSWVRDLLSGRHPTFRPGDFLLVEEAASGDVVSSLCLISQRWSYACIPFGVGRPELVATRADYRRRGLIRMQMDAVHEWSAARGELVQAITGIPNYYRQFGYEMALELGGGRTGYAAHVPALKEGRAEPFHLRPAVEADLPAIARAYEAGSRRNLVACLRDEAQWRYELAGRSPGTVIRLDLAVLERPGGEVVGFVAHPTPTWRGTVHAELFELEPGTSWLEATPCMVRYLWKAGEAIAARGGEPLQRFSFSFGTQHPAYRAFDRHLPATHAPYAWYLRVPDLAGFVRHVAPALEARLAESPAPGYSGELRLNFYRDGLRMAWEGGRLAAAERWAPESSQAGEAAFPGLTFLQLLFGFRSLADLKHAFCDCWTEGDEAPVVLDALFPQRPSSVWPVA